VPRLQSFRTEPYDRYLALLFDRCEMGLFLELDGPLNVPQVSLAVQLLLEAIPLLRCQFVEHWWQPRFEEVPEVTPARIVATEVEGDPEESFLDFLRRPMDHSWRVVVRNGVRGTLEVKLDHRLADFRALTQLVYLLAEVYSQLERDPGYVPPPQPFERGYRQVTRTIPFRQRLRYLQAARQATRKFGRPGRWRLPSLPSLDAKQGTVLHTFDAAEVEALEAYGCDIGGTVFHVLMAAYFLTMVEFLRDSDPLLQVITSIDLRRYLPPDRPVAICNLMGSEFLHFRHDRPASLAEVVREIHEQLFERRGAGLGLGAGYAAQDLVPMLRGLPQAIPFGWLRRYSRGWKAKLLGSLERYFIQAHQGGDLNPQRLRFGNLSPQRAFGCPAPLGIPGDYHFGMTGFNGTVTGYWRGGPQPELEQIHANVLRLLAPVLSTPAST
jgi:hypothetical protein